MDERRLQTFARLALATTLATYLLILVGGLGITALAIIDNLSSPTGKSNL